MQVLLFNVCKLYTPWVALANSLITQYLYLWEHGRSEGCLYTSLKDLSEEQEVTGKVQRILK